MFGIGFESGFVLFTYLVTRFTNNYQVFLIIVDVVIFILFYKAFSSFFNKDCLFAFTVFIILHGNRLFVSTLRQVFAIAFFLLALRQYVNNKNWLVYILLAILFHYSAVFFLLVMILYKILKNKVYYTVALFATFILSILSIDLTVVIIDILSRLSDFYPQFWIFNKMGHSVYSVIAMRFSINDIILYSFAFIVTISNKEISVFHILVLLALIFRNLFPGITILTARLGYYCTIGGIVFGFYLIRKYDKHHFLKIAMFVYCILSYTLKYIPQSDDYNFYNPYKNYLLEIAFSSDDPYDKANVSGVDYAAFLKSMITKTN
jgi:hypothetical protein